MNPDEQPELSLTDFKRVMYPRYRHARHLQELDEVLTAASLCAETGGRDGLSHVIVSMPPRDGKSLTASRLFPAWHLGRNPDHRIIEVSYAANLTKKNSRWARNFIASQQYRQMFPNVRLSRDSKSVEAWDLAGAEGGMEAVGVGGSLTGKGGHLIIIDDPIKNRAQAESATYRENLWEWYTDDLYTRREPGAAVLLIMTRWHTDDLIGRLLEREPGKWYELRLPAMAEENDPIGRAKGEALWPERFPLKELENIQSTLGPYGWAGLYQQQPVPSTGGLFDTEKIEVINYVPECTEVVRFYDLAVTAKRSSDYTAGLKLGVTRDEEFIILDVWKDQKELPDVQKLITQTAHIDGRDVRIRLEAEKAGIVSLQFLLRDPAMRPYTIDAVPPVGDKFTRAGPVASRVNAGRFKMVRGGWNRAFLEELALFGASAAHDDQVDALSGAYDMLAGSDEISFDSAPDGLNDWRGR